MKTSKKIGKISLGNVRPLPDDVPKLTRDFFLNGEVRAAGKVIRRGRPPINGGKEAVKLRIDSDVLKHFREGGPGWQSRINETLRRAFTRQKADT